MEEEIICKYVGQVLGTKENHFDENTLVVIGSVPYDKDSEGYNFLVNMFRTTIDKLFEEHLNADEEDYLYHIFLECPITRVSDEAYGLDVTPSVYKIKRG